MAARMGQKKALLAVGHKILCAIYYMLTNRQPYQPPDTEALKLKLQQKQLDKYLEKIKGLGYEVQLTTTS
jgi:hypothetical protein